MVRLQFSQRYEPQCAIRCGNAHLYFRTPVAQTFLAHAAGGKDLERAVLVIPHHTQAVCGFHIVFVRLTHGPYLNTQQLTVLLAAVVVCLGNTMNSMGRISAALEGVDLAAVAEQVSKLDMDAVNRAISTLDGKISQMDVQAFNDAVAKLNGAVDALQSASDAVKSWGEGVSGGLAGLFGQ